MSSTPSWVVALALAAVPVAAQEPAPAAPLRREPIHWRLSVGAEESYESNVPFTQLFDQEDLVTRGNGRLTVTLPISRGALELGGEGGANLYRTVTGLNRFTWGAFGRMEHRFTRRAQFEARARVAQTFARDDPKLDATGSLPPMTLTRSDSVDAVWRQSVSRRLEAWVNGHGERFTFDTTNLQNGWTAGVRPGMDYSLGPRAGVGFYGEYARTATSPPAATSIGGSVINTVGRTIEIEQLAGTLRLKIERHVTLGLDGGATRFQSVLNGSSGTGSASSAGLVFYPPTITPTGAAALTGTVGPHTIIAFVSRRVEQTYGIGAVGTNRVIGLDYRVSLAKWVAFILDGADNHSAAPDNTTLTSGRALTTGFDFPLSAKVNVRTTYRYWEQQDPVRHWRDHIVTVALGRQFDWR